MAALAAGCGTTTVASPLQGTPRSYLLTVDQLVVPGFTIDTPAHDLSVAGVAGSDATRATRLAAAGFGAGAAVEYFRPVSNIADENGPIQVGDTVEVFASAAGAASILGDDSARLDGAPNAVAVSTGPLGDAAHATTRSVIDPASGVRLVEVTVEWRVANLVDVLVVRGRDGGTRLDDGLVLAHRQTVTELGLATPTALPHVLPSTTATTPTSAPSPAVSP